MKKIIIAIILISIFVIGGGFFIYKKNHTNISNNSSLNDFPYNSTRVSTSDTINSTDNQTNDSTNSNTLENENMSSDNNSTPQETKPQEETVLSEFTTKIYTKDSNRQNNISLTCSSLNDTYLENGATFSFCNTVGKASSSKGYKKADVFKDGEKVEALGGRQLPSKFYFV